MLSRYVFSLILIVGLVMGFAQEAGAIGQCSTVCSGPNKPCRLRCAIGSFATTCGQVSTTCVGFAKGPLEDNLFSTKSCELSTSADRFDGVVVSNKFETPGNTEPNPNNPLNDAVGLVTWIRKNVAFVENLVSRLRPSIV